MTALLIAWLIGLPTVFLVGLALGRHYRKLPKHIHIWAPWEPFLLSVVDSDGKPIRKQAAQMRDCLDCGYRQHEQIHAL